MSSLTIAVVATGDMGHGVGHALREHGHDPLTCLSGRSARSRALAEKAGIRDVPDLETAVAEADLFLSIVPPDYALDLGESVAAAMSNAGQFPTYVDCNAVSPDTVRQVAKAVQGAGAAFIDAGIVGRSPLQGTPKFYVSGPDVSAMRAIDGCSLTVKPCGATIGDASALKMCYAGLTKGTFTLHTAVLMAALSLGVYDDFMAELADSQKDVLSKMQGRVPFIPADSGRWIGEMEEIAATFRGAGVSGGFHDGAASVLRVLVETPFASEERESLNTSRGLNESIDEYVRHLAAGQPKA